MIVTSHIGGFEYTATVGAHEGSNNPANYIRVEGPGLRQPAEYTRHTDSGGIGASQEGLDAIRYTVDNIVFPLAMTAIADAHAKRGDAPQIAAPFMSGGGAGTAIAPNPSAVRTT